MAKVEYLLKNKSVLIIDDNELTRQVFKTLFEGQGATVYTSGHIEKSATILEGLISTGKLPALIVLDVKLPGCYGLRALYKIQKVWAKLRAYCCGVSGL